ncbi:MAG: hypothetical protein ACYTFO_03630 [Planctomycetota bacterium]
MTVGLAGGTITVDAPDSAIDGMTITVPPGACPDGTTFSITSEPFTGTIPEHSSALTPLIHVDNGGEFADDYMKVTIPIDLPQGNFAMGFFVNADGKLEGMPLTELTDTSITVVTRHFSDLLILTIPESEMPESVSSGFYPGRDDWEFPNIGSYLDPEGNCAGQMLTAAWYFYEKRLTGSPGLFGRYDNNGGTPTPETWLDNSNGYRFASVVQEDVDWDGELRAGFLALHRDGADSLTWKAFLYSIFITGEPQYLAVYNNNGGHALLIYGVDRANGLMLVADPNYPGDTKRRIRYANGKFEPYSSGSSTTAITSGNVEKYPDLCYFAKTACVPWAKITARWAEMQNGTIGDDKFPDHILLLVSSEDEEGILGDTFTTTADEVRVDLATSGAESLYFNFYRNGQELSPYTKRWTFSLSMGENIVGFYITGKHGLVGGELADGNYIDFRWVTITREAPPAEEETAEELTDDGLTGTTITGVYYGQLQTNTSREGEMLWIVDAENRFVLRNAPRVLSVTRDADGRVVSTTFRFQEGMGNPPIQAGQWRVCAGTSVGDYYAESEVFTTSGGTQRLTVNVGTPPPPPATD